MIIGKKIKKICKNFNIKFLINDDVFLTKKLNADGCHLGQKDMNVLDARKIIGNKIIGVTCHNSIKLAKAALLKKADYLAFGAFNLSSQLDVNVSKREKNIDQNAAAFILQGAIDYLNN